MGSHLRTMVLVAVAVATAASVSSACGGDGRSDGAPHVDVRVGGAQVEALVADTDEERELGLGGREGLRPNEGMLFELPSRAVTSFWMKGMKFPIDMIWIDRGRVIEVTANAMPPRPSTPNSALKLYRPNRPVTRVLEASAGWARRNGVDAGDRVEID
jgi:uncharacterized membrane protein (UPF0127 family)